MTSLRTASEIAKQLGFSPEFVRRESKAGRLAHIVISNKLRYRDEDVKAYLDVHSRPCHSSDNLSRKTGSRTSRVQVDSEFDALVAQTINRKRKSSTIG